MNILKKKLATKPAQADNLTDVAALLSSLHNEWAQQYGSMTSAEIFPTAPNFTTDKFKSLTENTKGLIYAIGDKNKPCQILVELSPSLVENVSNAKFGAKTNKNKTLTLFDLILLQPIAETTLRALTSLGIIMDGDKICARCTSPAAITQMGIELDTRQKWLCVNFPLTTEEDASDNENTIKIYFAEPMVRTLTAMAQSQKSQKTIDPTNPWANHMRTMVMDSTQMLEVVIEDITMSIADCTRLELGQIITLPGASHTRLNINARSTGGIQMIATSTLGIYKTNKAVKLLDDIDPLFLAGIADVEHRNPST